MKRIDVANGDADGLCALHQLHLAERAEATLVTGMKRDIALLERVQAGAGDLVTVCDVSIDVNRAGLERLLARGVRVRYFDHHYAGAIPAHPALEAHIDQAAGVCSSLLVDRYLGGQHRAWAVVAAFGDGLPETALTLAASLSLDEAQLGALRELGESINYNAYGESESDALLPPAYLYRLIGPYADPLACLADEPRLKELAERRRDDLKLALEVAPRLDLPWASARVMPGAPWSRRVSGDFANRLSTAEPGRAHAVLTPRTGGGYVASVRAPRGHPASVAVLCREFPSGGGRQQAGGINHLPAEAVEAFLERLAAYFGADGG
ncbi:MAG TPA: acetyltransferase [Burkholderiales bacterium]|nr:acetyltransferase [Burkholderiales bacterium]